MLRGEHSSDILARPVNTTPSVSSVKGKNETVHLVTQKTVTQDKKKFTKGRDPAMEFQIRDCQKTRQCSRNEYRIDSMSQRTKHKLKLCVQFLFFFLGTKLGRQ